MDENRLERGGRVLSMVCVEVGHMSSIRKKQQGNSLRVSAYAPGLVLGSWYSMFSPFIINSFIH